MKTTIMMNRILITGICFLQLGNAYSQISTTKVVEKKVDESTLSYDSTANFLGKDASLYKGQELYLKGKSESLQKYGYDGFILDYKQSSSSLKNTYKPIMPENESYIEYDIGGGKSIYDSLVGRYYTVLNVHKHPEAEKREYLYGDKFYLELQEKESGDVIFYEYDGKYEHSFPFLVVGFYEHLKNQYVGNNYVICTKYFEGTEDFKTGEEVHITPGQKWECTDITIEEEYYKVSLVFKNELGEQVLADHEYLFELGGKSQVYTWADAEKYKSKFGVSNWHIILNREVKIGFTEEMVKLAWGEPEDVNRASYGDQWVYDDQYLYFENGKLKAFN